jgi:hypothetical protein
MQQHFTMTSLTKRLNRPSAIIHQGYAVCASFQGYKQASNSVVSHVLTDPKHTVTESNDETVRSNSKITEKYSDGPDLSDFIAGVVPRYINIVRSIFYHNYFVEKKLF